MRLLVLGSGGMLGRAVVADARRLGHDVVALTHADLDVTDADHVTRVVTAAEPRAVVNCTGFTDVDGAESDEGRALRVNGDGAGNVARGAAEASARVVHVSTDYVFDGSKREPWLESDPVAPLQAYGRTKLAGERAVADANPEHAIVRAAWLFGAGGPNFVATMLRLAAERDEVTVVTDQRGSPTWTGHLAAALVEVAEREGDVGLFHAGGNGECSWSEFAVEIFDRARMRRRVVPTTSERFARPARRPAYSVLGTEREPGIVLPPWQDGLAAYLAEQAGTGAAAA
jgi:dTDP-4-dehydrorhamnose reductase